MRVLTMSSLYCRSMLRSLFRRIKGMTSLVIIVACLCLVLLYTGRGIGDRDIPVNQLLRSPYSNPIEDIGAEQYIQEMARHQTSGLKQNDISQRKGSGINNLTNKTKVNTPEKQADPPEGRSKNDAVNIVRKSDDPLSSRPDLTMTTQTKIYPYLLNNPDTCNDPLELIVIVCSVPTNFEKRIAVRQTWGSDVGSASFKMKMVFLTGGSYTAENQRALKKENDEYNDIIQKEFVDSYMNLTLKSLVMLEWVTMFCNKSKYILKADDDMYFNLPNLIKALREHKDKKFIMGHLHDKGIPVRDKRSKWYIPREMYPLDNYPPFTVGVGYAMTTEAGLSLYATALSMTFFPMEDVYLTGIVGSKAKITRYNHNGFFDKYREPSCNYTRTIAEHKHEPEEMYVIHELLMSGKCS